MKLFILIVLFGALAVPYASARGGHTGTFQGISHDPATGARIVIEFHIGKKLAKNPEERKSWTRAIAVGDGKRWIRLKQPIEIDEKGNLKEKLLVLQAIVPKK
jgi:hypothetical protein